MKNLTRSEKTRAKREIAEFILAEIENTTQAGVSPVTGGVFKKLSKKYAADKKKFGKGSSADLHLTDAMLNNLRADIKSESIEFKITNKKEKLKAFNHNTGDTIPQRQFIPNENAKGTRSNFSKPIKQGVVDIIKEINGKR